MLKIANGTLVLPEGQRRADLYIQDGRIAAIGGDHPAEEVLDASGCLVFPGLIDAHTHLEMDTGTTWTADGYASGTLAALCGGTTTVLDFATQDRGGTLAAALEAWSGRAAGNCCCDYGFHMAVSSWDEATRRELADMVRRGVTSFKAYMAYDNLRLGDADLEQLLAATRELGYVGVHCELGDRVNENVRALLAAGKTGVENHPISRPNAVEGDAVKRYLELCAQAGAPAWVVHLSTREGLEHIRAARQRGQKVLVETCPQYLTCTEEVYRLPDFGGAAYTCSPPIRSKADQDALWQALEQGEIDLLSTDQCSFTLEQKRMGLHDFSKIPNGLPGIEYRFALVWSAGRLTPEQLARTMAETPARAFGLWPRKGSLLPGSDGDVLVWDPSWRGKLSAKTQHSACGYTPWEGYPVTGRPRAVYLRGTLCVENGEPVLAGDKPLALGLGRYVSRNCVPLGMAH